MNFGTIFEDNNILVIDKPAGIIVNKSDTTSSQPTIQDQIEGKLDLRSLDLQSDFFKRGGIVHRLDKETSGVLLTAKNAKTFENLINQFKERKVDKIYLSLVHGKVVPADGQIEVPVGRLPWNRKKFGILAGGRQSKTNYHVLEEVQMEGSFLSLLQLKPYTGRTHQIRVHLKHIGHPVFADPVYGGRKISREDRKILPRVFLHASKISLSHPTTGDRVSFHSPLPKDLSDLLKMLKFNIGGDL